MIVGMQWVGLIIFVVIWKIYIFIRILLYFFVFLVDICNKYSDSYRYMMQLIKRFVLFSVKNLIVDLYFLLLKYYKFIYQLQNLVIEFKKVNLGGQFMFYKL